MFLGGSLALSVGLTVVSIVRLRPVTARLRAGRAARGRFGRSSASGPGSGGSCPARRWTATPCSGASGTATGPSRLTRLLWWAYFGGLSYGGASVRDEIYGNGSAAHARHRRLCDPARDRAWPAPAQRHGVDLAFRGADARHPRRAAGHPLADAVDRLGQVVGGVPRRAAPGLLAHRASWPCSPSASLPPPGRWGFPATSSTTGRGLSRWC